MFDAPTHTVSPAGTLMAEKESEYHVAVSVADFLAPEKMRARALFQTPILKSASSLDPAVKFLALTEAPVSHPPFVITNPPASVPGKVAFGGDRIQVTVPVSCPSRATLHHPPTKNS